MGACRSPYLALPFRAIAPTLTGTHPQVLFQTRAHSMSEPFKTTEVDLAAYLTMIGHRCTACSFNESVRMGEFEFMPSPGLEKQVNLWRNGGAEEWKRFARARVDLYRWAKQVCDAKR